MKARCLIHTPLDKVDLREAEVRDPGAGEILVEAAYTCVSPGTELRCLRTGREGAGYVPGYALSGRVVKRGAGVAMEEGAAVLIGGTRDAGGLTLQWGGHISHALLRAADACPVPSGVDLLEASVARLGAIAFHGLRSSRPLASDRVAVIGLGVIGQLSARLHRLSGARVVAADRSPQRVAAAQAADIEAVVVEGTLKQTFEQAMPGGADIIVDATGVPAVLPKAVAVGRDILWDDTPFDGVRYLVQGSYESSFEVPYQEAFCRETSFLVPRSFQTRDLMAVLDLLSRRRLAVRDLTVVRRPEEAAEAYGALRDPGTSLLTVAFRWSEA